MNAQEPGRPRVTVTTSRLWRLRAARESPRHLAIAVCLAVVALSLRPLLQSPTISTASVPVAPSTRDVEAEAFAEIFARRYLSWGPGEQPEGQMELERLAGSAMEGSAGRIIPQQSTDHVEWATVEQERRPRSGTWVYTVAAQTSASGLVYLAVTVIRGAGGGLALGDYPAFVGPPPSGPAELPSSSRELDDPDLEVVVDRALRNYVTADGADLAADLVAGAQVQLPARGLALTSVQGLAWSASQGWVRVVVQAVDPRGVEYALAYEVRVVLVGGRWEVAAIEAAGDQQETNRRGAT